MKTNDYKQERAIQLLFTKKNSEKYLSREYSRSVPLSIFFFSHHLRVRRQRLGKFSRCDCAAHIRFFARENSGAGSSILLNSS
jgi:hypothetical protein